METLEERVARVLREEVHIVPYDPQWPELFQQECAHLRACLPAELLGRIEHFGSTAVPGLAAKPIVDMLVEVSDLQATQERIVPILEAQGYDYFWRPTTSPDDGLPYYAWFIKRGADGARSHHIHMVEPDYPHWGQLRFRDHLIAHPEVAQAYARLKQELAAAHRNDREAYTDGKTEFIAAIVPRESYPMKSN
jgi:GrpB-like predicted nucleotidyltransferase (UPF0157 family)